MTTSLRKLPVKGLVETNMWSCVKATLLIQLIQLHLRPSLYCKFFVIVFGFECLSTKPAPCCKNALRMRWPCLVWHHWFGGPRIWGARFTELVAVHEKLEIVSIWRLSKLWYPQQKHWEKPPLRYSLSLLFGASNTSLGNPGTYRHRSARTTTVRIQTVATYGLDQVLKSCKNTPKIWYFVGISSEIYTVYQCKMYLDNDEQDTLNMKAKTFEVQW